MTKSITRKFLVRVLPNLSNKNKDACERYYLYISDSGSIVVRVQKINETYELARKINKSNLIREEENIQITKEEFEKLKRIAKQKIQRDSYQIQENPTIVIRVYHGDYEGLKRIEVKFYNEEESQSFTPLDWFGKEITDTPLAQDGRLLQLTKEEFHRLLE